MTPRSQKKRPKTPKALLAQIRQANREPSKPGHERTPEGMEIPTPKRKDFLSNLEKVSKPEEG